MPGDGAKAQSNKPHVLFVPGFWEGPSVFDKVRHLVENAGYRTTVAPLLSTGHVNSDPQAPQHTVHTDTLGIRKVLEPLVVDEGLDVIGVFHSAGGFLGSGAMEGLTGKARSDKGLAGGVKKIIFLAAGTRTEKGGKQAPDQQPPVGAAPIFDIQGDRLLCQRPREVLFNDLEDEAEVELYEKALTFQPAIGYMAEPFFAGWREVPSLYLVCENDLTLSPSFQNYCARLAGSEVETCTAGHMVQLSQPKTVAALILRVAASVEPTSY